MVSDVSRKCWLRSWSSSSVPIGSPISGVSGQSIDYKEHKSSRVQCLAGLGLLSWDWHPSIILGIAKAAGNPVRIDERSLAGDYGHYVRVLVEVDLSLPIQEQVMIERTGHFRLLLLFYDDWSLQ